MDKINNLFNEKFPERTNGYNTLMMIMELKNLTRLNEDEINKLNLYTKEYLEDIDKFVSDVNMVYNLMKSIKMDKLIEYSKFSVIKELFQNIFDCDYINNKYVDIQIAFENNSIIFEYKEDGFTDNEVLKYLYIGNSDKDKNDANTGRFGIGAKFGIFKNAQNVIVESQNSYVKYYINISNNDDNIKLDKFDRKEQISNETYTKMILKFNSPIYNEIKQEFEKLLDKKGSYINIFELFFAAENAFERANYNIFKLKIDNVNYEIKVYENEISLKKNSKHVLGMLSYKSNNKFKYLIPKTRGNDDNNLPEIICKSKCNYFSTYELTGNNTSMVAFYISVPSKLVAPDRKSLIIDENEMKKLIGEDLGNIVRNIVKNDFYCEIDNSNNVSWTYLFQFIYEFIRDKYDINTNIKFFLSNLRVKFNDANKLISDMDVYRCESYPLYTEISANINYFDDESSRAKLFYYRSSSYKKQINYMKYDCIHIYFIYYYQGEIKKYLIELLDYKSGNVDVFLGRIFNHDSFRDVADSKEYRKLMLNKFCEEIKTIHDLERLNSLILENNEYKLIFDYNTKNLIIKLEEQDKIIDISNIDVSSVRKIKDIFTKLNINYEDGKEELKNFIIGRLKKYLKTLNTEEIVELFEVEDMKNNFKIYISTFEVCDLVNISISESFIEKISSVVKIQDRAYKEQLLSINFFRNNIIRIAELKTKQIIPENKIIRFLNPDNRDKSELINCLKKIYFNKSTKFSKSTIALLYSDEGSIKNIIEVNSINDIPDSRDADENNLLILTNSRDNTLADYLEKWLTGETNYILKKVIEHKNKVILLDQISYIYKFSANINKDEFEFLREEANKITNDNIKDKLIKDVNAKLFGYGYNCSIQVKQEGNEEIKCNYQGNSQEPFLVQEIEYTKLPNNKAIALPVFVCANDFYDMKSWMVTNITFGNETLVEKFNRLMGNIKNGNFEIDTSFFNCTIEYEYKVSYTSLNLDNTMEGHNMISNRARILLTPLIFAIWFNIYSKTIN